MDQLAFLRNRPTYRVERFLELKKIHELGGTVPRREKVKNEPEKRNPPEESEPSHSRPHRSQTNAVSTVKVKRACVLCDQDNFWPFCPKPNDPRQIAPLADSLASRSYCLKCVRPLAI